MASYGIEPADCTAVNVTVLGQAVPSVAISDNGIHVRRPSVADPNRFDRTARLLPYGYFVSSTRSMSALKEVFGLEVHVTFDDFTDASMVTYVQVSLDNGGTYLYHNGAAWVAQGLEGSYNTLKQFNEYCSTLPLLNPKSLKFRFKLSTQQGNPTFSCAAIHVQYEYDYMTDVLESIKSRLDQARLPTYSWNVLKAASASIPLSSFRYTIDQTVPPKVFNLTTDPNRNVNLFRDFNAGNLRLTVQQALGSKLEIQAAGYCKTLVVRQDETIHISELPYTMARVDSAYRLTRGVDSGYISENKVGVATMKVRTRPAPHIYKFSMCIEHWAADGDVRTMLASTQALQKAFSTPLFSLATGDILHIVDAENTRVEDHRIDSFFAGIWEFGVYVKRHFDEYREQPMVRAIRLTLGGFKRLWAADNFDVGVEP